MNDVAIILGTRPEIIKLSPVIARLQESRLLRPVVIATGQHDALADQAFRVFDIAPNEALGLMTDNQAPQTLLAQMLQALDPILAELNPRGVIVQGDTTSALGGSLAAFYHKISVAHVEAGLRTFNMRSPFPEEMNRTLISKVAAVHFAPTKGAAKNLEREGITDNVFTVGNTVVDAVEWVAEELAEKRLGVSNDILKLTSEASKVLLVTGHRRENFEQPIKNLCAVIERLVETLPDLDVIFPVHPNPNVKDSVTELLADKPRIHLIEPVDYPTAIFLMKRAQLIMTDSGGIQEEAPTFSRKVLVTRKYTERPEAIEVGSAQLVDLEKPDDVYETAIGLLTNSKADEGMKANPFGDGKAAKRIVTELERFWG